MAARIITSILIIGAIIFLPYWVYVPLVFIAAAAFPFFWEGVIIALFIDALYGKGVSLAPASFSILSLSMFAFIIMLLPVREQIRSHA